MAIITLNYDKGTISILVEKTDSIRRIQNDEIESRKAEHYMAGTVFANETVPLCMIRGERS